MKNIWKNVLGVALIAAISSGAAIGTSTYLMNKNHAVRWSWPPELRIPSSNRTD